MPSHFPCSPVISCERKLFVKENPDRKKKKNRICAFSQRIISFMQLHDYFIQSDLFLIGIHSMQPTTRHGATRKRSKKRLKCTGNMFRKNLQLKDVC